MVYALYFGYSMPSFLATLQPLFSSLHVREGGFSCNKSLLPKRACMPPMAIMSVIACYVTGPCRQLDQVHSIHLSM